ncbi:MAG: hypothetical protein P8R54_16880 [Myxococcota bacterium]|nr:hypothetical protein [Myxococcota bacterium]
MNHAVSPGIPFRDTFDRIQAERGPPAVFIVDAEGEIKVELVRTRDSWQRLEGAVPAYGICHCLFRDRATGFVQYILVTSPELCASHPRADITRYPDQPTALAALSALGRPPLQPSV